MQGTIGKNSQRESVTHHSLNIKDFIMPQLSWTIDNLTSQLGNLFLMKVKNNMRNHEKSIVQFGITGTGQQPNYQVTLPNGTVHTINGLSHKQDKRTDLFNGSNLSEPFTYEQICTAHGDI